MESGGERTAALRCAVVAGCARQSAARGVQTSGSDWNGGHARRSLRCDGTGHVDTAGSAITLRRNHVARGGRAATEHDVSRSADSNHSSHVHDEILRAMYTRIEQNSADCSLSHDEVGLYISRPLPGSRARVRLRIRRGWIGNGSKEVCAKPSIPVRCYLKRLASTESEGRKKASIW